MRKTIVKKLRKVTAVLFPKDGDPAYYKNFYRRVKRFYNMKDRDVVEKVKAIK